MIPFLSFKLVKMRTNKNSNTKFSPNKTYNYSDVGIVTEYAFKTEGATQLEEALKLAPLTAVLDVQLLPQVGLVPAPVVHQLFV